MRGNAQWLRKLRAKLGRKVTMARDQWSSELATAGGSYTSMRSKERGRTARAAPERIDGKGKAQVIAKDLIGRSVAKGKVIAPISESVATSSVESPVRPRWGIKGRRQQVGPLWQ